MQVNLKRIVLSLSLGFALTGVLVAQDARDIKTGMVIPDETYSDQPYIVKTNDGAWLCVLTTGTGHEGASGQHLISQRSLDQGKTWIDKRDVEPGDGPEASYAVLLKAPSGRIFVFYNHNTDNIRAVKGDNPPYADGLVKRVDSQGYFVFKYSDDNGKSWSANRVAIPMRNFEIDKKNPYQGKIQYFWNVGRAFAYKESAYVPVHKVGGFGEGFFTSSEGALLQSPDLFTATDPAKAKWNTLPDGEIGLRTPAKDGGPIAEEQNFVVLSDGSFFCVYRTIDGYPAYTYSRDAGHTWEPPQYMRYGNGQLMKHPRAANFVWKCENGKYLYWFHNHGGRFIREHKNRRSMAYEDRNPAWVSGGVEVDSPKGKVIRWTQPEVLLYDEDPLIRMSYPDLVEDKGSYYITETQKDIARVHKIDEKLLNLVWNQFDNAKKAQDGLVTNWSYQSGKFPQTVAAPTLPEFYKRDTKKLEQPGMNVPNGFTVDLSFNLSNLSDNQILLDARDATGKGWFVRTTDKKTVEFAMNDGRTESTWSCDEGLLKANQNHHVSIIVDGGPHLIYFVVDGNFNDGGDTRQFGWGRFNPYLKSVAGAAQITLGTQLSGRISQLSVYNRALTVSEAIGNYNAQKKIP
ncbi:LamG-like jellyroll fold domain-containing protein [Larkinella sp. GY13]|uniref:LamG-like jellyroll fold domain-containing protein n=1 Tax=Larkinella sp. GY13 TaxID=3453720 RepID=UPI003EEE1C9C